MKSKKITALLTSVSVLLACCCFMTSCSDLVDVAPKSYADWDGNYIYRGNVRSKTTGEEDEYLIETLQKNETEYTVTETIDYQIVEDDIYMCLGLTETQSVAQTTSQTCLAVYNVKEKTTKVIYWADTTETLGDVYAVGENYILLGTYEKYGSSSNGMHYIRIDHDGNMLSENEDWINTTNRVGDYFITQTNGQFFYCSIEDSNQNLMFGIKSVFNDYYVEYYEQDGHKGFLIRIVEGGGYAGLYFYDILQKKTSELVAYGAGLQFEDNWGADFGEHEYFVVGEKTQEEYHESYWAVAPLFGFLPIFFPKTYENDEIYESLKNCKLYELDFSGTDVALKLVYDFAEEYSEKDFSCFYVLGNGDFYFEAVELRLVEGTTCMGGSGPDYSYYVIDAQTQTLSKCKAKNVRYSYQTEEERWQERRDNGAICGQYSYFLTSDFYNDTITNGTAFTLYRYDTQSQKDEAMQFFLSCEDYQEGSRVKKTDSGDVTLRYSVKLWSDYEDVRYYEADMLGFIVRNY